MKNKSRDITNPVFNLHSTALEIKTEQYWHENQEPSGQAQSPEPIPCMTGKQRHQKKKKFNLEGIASSNNGAGKSENSHARD